MFRTLHRKWLALGLITLLGLNFLAVYILNQSIENRKLLAHASAELKESLQQKDLQSDLIISAIFTLDVVVILVVLYLLVKTLIKIMKTQSN